MKNLFALLLTSLLLSSSISYAATGSWNKSTNHYTIYFSGDFATMPFSPPAGVPNSGTVVTTIEYTWTNYGSGRTSEIVELCFSARASGIIGDCINISASQSGIVNYYAGKSARDSWYIRHTITGGTYPTTVFTADTVKVNYTY